MINRLIEYAIQNRVIIIILTLILFGLGIKSFIDLPVDVYPDLNAPVVNIMTESHGTAPEDVETLITFPVESAMRALPYVKRVRSNSTLGLSKVTVEFEYGTDIYFARQLVSEKLQMIAQSLPDESDAPFIGPISSMFADAIEFTIQGGNLYDMREFADWELKPRLQTVPGVSNVVTMGGLIRQVQVLIDPNRMLNFGIHAEEVVTALKENNINASGGFLDKGAEEQIIRGLGRIASINDVRQIVLKSVKGIPITINEIADVEFGPYIRRGTAGESGEEVIIVTVQNQYNANVMKTIQGVEEVLDDVKSELPEGWTIQTFYNQLDMITKSIRNVSSSILLGAVFVILILYLFLNNVRSTLIVAVVIPLSAVFAFIFFRLFNLSLNIMTLGGLAIGLGMIVDSSIIMTENIFRHLQDCDSDFKGAVLNGAKEVGRPIFYAIVILLAVFAPIFTLQGIEGRMFIPLTIAVSAAVLGSLLISLTLTPVLTSLIFRERPDACKDGWLLSHLKKGYAPLLKSALAKPRALFLISAFIIVAGVLSAFFVGSEFMPEMDESALLVDIQLPPEASLEESSRIATLVSRSIAGLPDVERMVRATGKARGAEHTAPVNLTHANCVLVPKENRSRSIEEIKQDIRRVTSDIPGVFVQINAPLQHRINHVATGIRSTIAVKIFGESLGEIQEIAKQIKSHMSEIEGVTDLQIEQGAGQPQLTIQMNRPALARYGLSIKEVSELIEIALNGKVATEWIQTHKRTDVFVRYLEPYRNDPETIRNLLIETKEGFRLPLSAVADIREDQGPNVIRRENALRRGVVQCNVTGRDMGRVVRDIKTEIGLMDMPEGYFVTFGGTYENQIRAMRQLTLVVLLTIIMVFSLLVISFRSLRQALLILINIPLALVGGMLILLISGNTLSVPSIVGFIALIGIAVQDGIVLVTHINKKRDSGMEMEDAILQAGRNKIRPVLLTSFTTMLGLLPLVLRNASGSEIQKPLALVIMFGLFFSTLLTLIVLPVLYGLLERNRALKNH
ncbi:efflux RND transporter permease subunit [candidate division KSB1 bacterium]|nr:efflux RND transporter permease subunit [candidate division KSB1 bacterium]